MDLLSCKKLVEAKQIIILDVDEIFLSVTQGKYNRCRKQQLLEKIKISNEQFKEIEKNCGIYNDEVTKFFAEMDYSNYKPAFDFTSLFSNFVLDGLLVDGTVIHVCSLTPSSFSKKTHSTKLEFIKDVLDELQLDDSQYHITFTERTGEKAKINNVFKEKIIKIVDDNVRELLAYKNQGFCDSIFMAPERLIWKERLEIEFPKMKFYE